ncbi:hypothetical protein ATANTOWER_031221 [Ataeniobius toweri]|uniref:Uncharacterized protein n=1 Tax=Ataeniobius toweri TaxID=208326 RepID=A0ABU7A367_9TELE|nr:hypothetical protein [Ataeniobius toweri]
MFKIRLGLNWTARGSGSEPWSANPRPLLYAKASSTFTDMWVFHCYKRKIRRMECGSEEGIPHLLKWFEEENLKSGNIFSTLSKPQHMG